MLALSAHLTGWRSASANVASEKTPPSRLQLRHNLGEMSSPFAARPLGCHGHTSILLIEPQSGSNQRAGAPSTTDAKLRCHSGKAPTPISGLLRIVRRLICIASGFLERRLQFRCPTMR